MKQLKLIQSIGLVAGAALMALGSPAIVAIGACLAGGTAIAIVIEGELA